MADATTIEEDERAVELAEARHRDTEKGQKSVFEIAQRVAGKLNKLIERGHDTTAFSIALLLAALKDGVDIGLDFLFLAGEIPIIGQLPGVFISAVLAYFLWGKGWFKTTKVKIILWGLGFVFDNLPLANDLPMTILTVLWAWHIVRERAQHAERNLMDLKEKTAGELEEIELSMRIE
jgi:hypothetical protein